MAAVCDPAGFTGVSRCRAAGLVLKSLFPGFRGGTIESGARWSSAPVRSVCFELP